MISFSFIVLFVFVGWEEPSVTLLVVRKAVMVTFIF